MGEVGGLFGLHAADEHLVEEGKFADIGLVGGAGVFGDGFQSLGHEIISDDAGGVVGVFFLVLHPADDLVWTVVFLCGQLVDLVHGFFDGCDVLGDHVESRVVAVDAARYLAV